MPTLDKDQRIPQNTLVYIGRRTLRNDAEPDVNQDERVEKYPEQYPHTFVDFGGAKVVDVMGYAGGKQGCVVDTQKVVRDKHTLNEVNAWRERFDLEMFREAVWNNILNIEEVPIEEILVVEDDEEILGDPFVVIDFKTSGSKLSVPKQPKDILEIIKQVPILYEKIEDMTEEEQLAEAPKLMDQLAKLKDSGLF